MNDIKIYELKRMDLKGALVIDGFPSVGLVSSIVANYLINTLHLEPIAIMDSIHFPTVSLIKNSEPHNPVRIYAGSKYGPRGRETGEKIVSFISEFQPQANVVKQIGSTMLDWCEDQRCGLVICPEGLVIENNEPTSREKDMDLRVYGIGSTKKSRELLLEPNVLPFREGVITGIAGVLLNEGKRRDFDVISLLAEAHQDYPDARAAGRIIEILDKLFFHIRLDPKPLYDEAERIEAQLKIIQRQTGKGKDVKIVPSEGAMYR